MNAPLRLDDHVAWIGERNRLVRVYADAGFRPIRLGTRQKAPSGPWANGEADLDPSALSNDPFNVGVRLGEPSGGLCDIDFDMPQAAEIAELIWPAGATFGRPSNPKSHRVVLCADADRIVNLDLPLALQDQLGLPRARILEVRGNGHQTMFPPSIHPSGEQVFWHHGSTEPPQMSWQEAVGLAKLTAFLAVIYARYPRTAGNRDEVCMALAGTLLRAGVAADRTDHLVTGLARLAGDEEAGKRAKAAQTEDKQKNNEPTTGLTRLCELLGLTAVESQLAAWLPGDKQERLIFSPSRPRDIAIYYKEHVRPHLIYFAGEFYDFDAPLYRKIDETVIVGELYELLDRAYRPSPKPEESPRRFDPNRRITSDVLHALAPLVLLHEGAEPPCWREGEGPNPRDLLVCRNALVDLPRGEMLEPTPRLVAFNGLAFDYQPEAPQPERWRKFLSDLWPDDPAAAECLQEIMGYLLTPDTAQQKIFLLVGPPRSGKGTIARVIRELVGPRNVCDPNLKSIGERFGLEAFLGKSVAIFNDARIGGRADFAAITENLLRISGEDSVTVDRKHLKAVEQRLSTRILITTNELPRLPDAATALATRCVPIVMRRSFLGREDQALTEKLRDELPGILNWAIDGWRRLRERGHFVPPESGVCAIEHIKALASPVRAFVDDCCEVGASFTVQKDKLYVAFQEWASRNNEHPVAKNTFGEKLRAAVPEIDEERPWIDGRRVRLYRGIALRDEAQADELPF